jgi:tetratricopeptide (TPR) repeat protein
LIGVAIAIPALAQSGSVTTYPSCPDPPPKLSPAEVEAARASYRVGVEAYNNSDYKKALDNIKDAFRRDCSKVALLEQLARIYESLGDRPEAIHALETYLQRSPKADDADQVQIRIQNLKAQLGTTTATAATATATATTTTTATATVTVTVPTATATATAIEPTGGHTAGPWIVVGIGVAAAIAGGVLIGVGQGDINTAHSGNCTADGTIPTQLSCDNLPGFIGDPKNDGSDTQRGTDQSNGNVLRGTGIAVAAVGLASIVGGLIWHFVESPSKPASSATMFSPVLAPGYAGFAYSRNF